MCFSAKTFDYRPISDSRVACIVTNETCLKHPLNLPHVLTSIVVKPNKKVTIL